MRIVSERRLPHLLFALAYAIVALIVVFARPATSPQDASAARTVAAEPRSEFAVERVPATGR
ncbi:MAG: hypothetical protein ABSG76_13735 [Xanthobacteraceae bacterium]